jgi:hypothetical protein
MRAIELALAACLGGIAALAIVGTVGKVLERLEPAQATVLIDEPDFHRSDWMRCAPEPRAPITAPAPGKAHFDYRSRDGGRA